MKMAEINTLLSSDRRLYISVAPTEPAYRQLIDLGAKWCSLTKSLFISSAMREQVIHIISQVTGPNTSPRVLPENPFEIVLVGKARYESEDYFILEFSRDKTQMLLVTADGARQFWSRISSDCGHVLAVYHPFFVRENGEVKVKRVTLGHVQNSSLAAIA